MVTSASSKSTACDCRNRARNKFFSDEEGSRCWRHSRKDRERKILERLSSVDTERRRGSAGGLDLIRSVLLLLLLFRLFLLPSPFPTPLLKINHACETILPLFCCLSPKQCTLPPMAPAAGRS